MIEASHGDTPALTGLAATLAPRRGVVLWVSRHKGALEHGRLLAAGAQVFAGRSWRCLTVAAGKRMDALWAVDEAARSRAASCIIAEVEDADFTVTRRLKLVSEESGVPIILLMPHRREGASACRTRWRINSLPSAANPYDPRAPGRPRWRARLERCRPAPHRAGEVFDLEHDDETLSLRLVSRLAAGAAEARAPDLRADLQQTG